MSKAKTSYNKYINSRQWKSKRNEFRIWLATNKITDACWACGVPENQSLFHVHHRFYSNKLGSESIDSLSLLCEECHSKLHNRHNKLKNKVSLWEFSNLFIKQERKKNGFENLPENCFKFVPPESIIFQPLNPSKQQLNCWSLTKQLSRCRNKPVKQGLCNRHRPTKSRPHQRPVTKETS
jgi:hypothetical protein